MNLRYSKIVFLLAAVVLLFSSCGRDNTGQLIGAQDRPKFKENTVPLGMVYIPSGYFTIGSSDQDIFSSYQQRQKTVSMAGFYMDETEITNNEYRQFVEYVRDTEAHILMGDTEVNDYGEEIILRDFEIDYTDPTLEDMFYSKDRSLSGRREFNDDNLTYTYSWINWKKAAKSRSGVTRDEVIETKEVKVAPDRFVFIRDFAYSSNDPMTRNYFENPVFDDYPIVGVTWGQAKAFCHWRTQLWNESLDEDQALIEDFRLPTEFEWEYAARGGRDIASYGWGGYYARNSKGCLLANFKPGRGNYQEDGGYYTVNVGSYFPNDYGLFDMSGNVSEWTETAYVPGGNSVIHDMNPDIKYDAKDDDPALYKLKVVRGGSWKDVWYYLHSGTRDYEFQDSTKSFIGFRSAMTYLGRSPND